MSIIINSWSTDIKFHRIFFERLKRFDSSGKSVVEMQHKGIVVIFQRIQVSSCIFKTYLYHFSMKKMGIIIGVIFIIFVMSFLL